MNCEFQIINVKDIIDYWIKNYKLKNKNEYISKYEYFYDSRKDQVVLRLFIDENKK